MQYHTAAYSTTQHTAHSTHSVLSLSPLLFSPLLSSDAYRGKVEHILPKRSKLTAVRNALGVPSDRRRGRRRVTHTCISMQYHTAAQAGQQPAAHHHTSTPGPKTATHQHTSTATAAHQRVVPLPSILSPLLSSLRRTPEETH